MPPARGTALFSILRRGAAPLRPSLPGLHQSQAEELGARVMVSKGRSGRDSCRALDAAPPFKAGSSVCINPPAAFLSRPYAQATSILFMLGAGVLACPERSRRAPTYQRYSQRALESVRERWFCVRALSSCRSRLQKMSSRPERRVLAARSGGICFSRPGRGVFRSPLSR